MIKLSAALFLVLIIRLVIRDILKAQYEEDDYD